MFARRLGNGRVSGKFLISVLRFNFYFWENEQTPLGDLAASAPVAKAGLGGPPWSVPSGNPYRLCEPLEWAHGGLGGADPHDGRTTDAILLG